ncbi:hypothetical protein JEQ12_010852 [Ovis aries]|uniref:Uncharacterized protein n=1 Tax=Ovis aries TaxID=9940 RepID=A0A835ZP01_SHEEP|nr:hypothetical protein JEQ12_010852 [Ovis aries]
MHGDLGGGWALEDPLGPQPFPGFGRTLTSVSVKCEATISDPRRFPEGPASPRASQTDEEAWAEPGLFLPFHHEQGVSRELGLSPEEDARPQLSAPPRSTSDGAWI